MEVSVANMLKRLVLLEHNALFSWFVMKACRV